MAGISVGNPVATTLSRALWALIVFYFLGTLMGYVAQRVVDEHAISLHREMFGDEASRNEPADAAKGDDEANAEAVSTNTAEQT